MAGPKSEGLSEGRGDILKMPSASLALIAKAPAVCGERGYEGGKTGEMVQESRKRHLLVDTGGLVLNVTMHPAAIKDRAGVKSLLPHDHQQGYPHPVPTAMPCLAGCRLQ